MSAAGSDRPARPGQPAWRELTVAVLLAAVGSGLALYAASRAWVITEVARPQPLPPVVAESSGRDVVPWAAAMAFVGLAGGIALPATRRLGRVVVAAVVAFAGAVMVAGALAGWATGAGPGERVEVRGAWPALFLAGGAAALAAGTLAIVRGRRWAAMGERYEAPGGAAPARSDGPAPARDDATGLWDALDRGEDPTTR
jgi:uncharacterized membrane protein (TIGR02234 family)